MEFLRTVKYRPEMDQIQFRQFLAQSDPAVVHPVLKWVLSQADNLTKRAFVGYYMTPVLMPDELSMDHEVAELRSEIEAYQQQFVELHKTRDGQIALKRDPQLLKTKMNQMEGEKEVLHNKIERVKGKTSGIDNMKALHEACSALRKQQDEEVDLMHKLVAQRQQLAHAEQKFQRNMARLRELRTSAMDGSASGILDQLQDEHSHLRDMITEKLPRDMEKRQKRLKAVAEVLGDGFNSEADLNLLKQRQAEINADIAAVTDRRQKAEREAQGNKAYQQLRSTQQMANVVAKKKDELAAKMERLTDKKESLESEYGRRVAHEDGGGSFGAQPSNAVQPGAASEGDYQNKYADIRSKLPEYKKKKKVMSDIEGEISVLERTVDVLGKQELEMMREVNEIEREKGVQGFTETQANLEKISEAKSAIDEEKGNMLTEISKTVTEINQAIKDRKSHLAPQIQELRKLRQQFLDLETEHTEKKKLYESAKSAHESKLSKLDNEVAGYKEELATAESKYHQVNCQLKLVDVNIRRVTQGAESLNLRDKYQRRVKEAEEENQDLKVRQKHLKDSAAPSQEQMAMMRDLKRLMEMKMQVLKRGNVGQFGAAPAAAASGSATAFNADMMVL